MTNNLTKAIILATTLSATSAASVFSKAYANDSEPLPTNPTPEEPIELLCAEDRSLVKTLSGSFFVYTQPSKVTTSEGQTPACLFIDPHGQVVAMSTPIKIDDELRELLQDEEVHPEVREALENGATHLPFSNTNLTLDPFGRQETPIFEQI